MPVARRARSIAMTWIMTVSLATHAATTPPAPAPLAPAGVLLQTLLGLAVVLALVLGCAWIMKRLQLRTSGPGGILRVVAATAVGQRERVVLVEVGGTLLVVGVAPGRVSALHTMSRADLPVDLAQADSATPPFGDWLKRFMDQRRAN